MADILIVEDDQSLGSSLKRYIEEEGHNVHWASSLKETREACSDKKFELIILDWMLPDGQGIDYLKEVRAGNGLIPIIMLTARTELIDKVIGLETGADDYITKPFEPRELIARIRSQLRRHSNTANHSKLHAVENFEKIELGDLVMDLGQREVFYESSKIELTKMEFDFLRLLAENPNRAFSRDEILNKVWGYEHYPSTRTVDTHVLQLRQKLTDELIETVRGIGYRLRHPLAIFKE